MHCDAYLSLTAEFEAWNAAGRPDGYGCENLPEYWSELAPRVRAKDEALVKTSEPLREEGIDLFAPDYERMLDRFVEKNLALVRQGSDF